MSIEFLVKLAPGTVNLEGTGGGRPELTSEELGCYLIGATDQEWWLAMTLYVGEDYSGKLARYLYDLTNKWNLPLKNHDEMNLPVYNKMGYLAVAEYMDTGICPLCRGEKVVNAKECPACHGTGAVRRSDADKARYCHIQPKRWVLFEPVLDRMLLKLGAMDAANKSKIFKAMSDDQKDIEID